MLLKQTVKWCSFYSLIRMIRLKVHCALALLLVVPAARLPSEPAPKNVRAFLQSHCLECHDSDLRKGGLDLTELSFDLNSRQTFSQWVKVGDRVAAGEMPPRKKPRPATGELRSFTNSLCSALLLADRARISL